MKAFIEMTEWDDGKSYHHVYWMNDSKAKIYAYARWATLMMCKCSRSPFKLIFVVASLIRCKISSGLLIPTTCQQPSGQLRAVKVIHMLLRKLITA